MDVDDLKRVSRSCLFFSRIDLLFKVDNADPSRPVGVEERIDEDKYGQDEREEGQNSDETKNCTCASFRSAACIFDGLSPGIIKASASWR